MMHAMSETSKRTRPSGWYTDPEDEGRLRKWDGIGWTDSWMAAAPGTLLAPARRERFWDGEQWTRRLRHGSVFPGRPALGPSFFTLSAGLRGLFYLQVAVSAVGAIVAVWVVSVLNRWLRAPEAITVADGNRVDSRSGRVISS